MPKAEYIRKINQSSLMITPEKEYETEKDSIEMFRYHQIPDFLKMKVQKRNTNAQFCYDITSKRSLEQLLEYKLLDYLLLLKILSSFDDACRQIEDFMMTENDILLEPAFVFADHNLDYWSYCYVPGNQSDICQQFKGFMGYLLQHLDHKDKRAVRLAYDVYQRVVEEQTALHVVLQDDEFQQIPQDADTEKNVQDTDAGRLTRDVGIGKNVQSACTGPLTKDTEKNVQDAGAGQYVQDMGVGRFTQDAGAERFTQDMATGRYIQDAGARQFYLQAERRVTENGCQQFEGDQRKHVKMHSFNIMEEPDRKSVYDVGEKDRIMGIADMDNAKMEYGGDRQQIQYGMTNRQKKEKTIRQKQTEQQEQRKPVSSFQGSDTESKIQQKETIRRQAAKKLKNMLRKKIYTDRARFPEEDTVFEADAEDEMMPRSNPTVCLMPENADIQNRFVYQGPDRSRDFHCMNGKMILGSDLSESDIYIPVPMVSRVHARIEIDANGTFLEDLNSTNGTHVNGELLQFHERRILQKGDVISLAGECYSFH